MLQGADWFESALVDYDVCSNWGNWVAAAGLTGGSPREIVVIVMMCTGVPVAFRLFLRRFIAQGAASTTSTSPSRAA